MYKNKKIKFLLETIFKEQNNFDNKRYNILNKIENNELINSNDINIINDLLKEKSYEEVFKVFEAIDTYNLSLEKTIKQNLENNSVKNIFDIYFTDAQGKLIVDSNGNTVYDCLPDSYKLRLKKRYLKEKEEFENILAVIFTYDEFEFMRNYGTSFNDLNKLKEEQKELCKFVLYANYDLITNQLLNECKRHGIKMEQLLRKIPGIYKHVECTNSLITNLDMQNQHNVETEKIYVLGSYEHYKKNISKLYEIDREFYKKYPEKKSENLSSLAKSLINSKYAGILTLESTKFENKLNELNKVINSYWPRVELRNVVKDIPILLISSHDLVNTMKLLYSYDINLKNPSDLLGAVDIKNRINLFIEAGMYDLIKKYPSYLERNSEFIKKYYYGNNINEYGLEESKQNLKRPIINNKGIKGSFNAYDPKIARKYYDDLDNYVSSDLLKKYRDKIPAELLIFLNGNYNKYLGAEKNDNILNDKIIEVFDEKYKKSNYIYDINGVIISRYKFIDILYLHNEFIKQQPVVDMEIKNYYDDSNKEAYILNALLYNSYCDHYSLLNIIKAVAEKKWQQFKDVIKSDDDETKGKTK